MVKKSAIGLQLKYSRIWKNKIINKHILVDVFL